MKTETSTSRPRLFDSARLATRRDRAERCGFQGRGDFLHAEVATLLGERLGEVTRAFDNAAIVGSGGGLHHAILAPHIQDIQQVEWSERRAERAGVEATPFSETLPFAEASLDLVVSMLEMHWLNDPVGHLIQLRRALRPDGLMIAALFGGETLNELRNALTQAEVDVTGGLSPRIAPMGEIRDLGGLLQRAGLTMPVADSERIRTSYPDIIALMRDLRAMGETNILTDRRRVPMRRDMLARAGAIYAEKHSLPDGRLSATFEVIFLTGWAPAPDQPVALRPGSAKARLADALSVEEHGLGEKAAPTAPGPKKA
ncbi:MAG: methyltransferase domain-containing protein [Pseudomonadota bacterium]